jgi:Thioredoxin-like domain
VGCARLEAESYADATTADYINANFLPVEAHIKEHPAWFHRFDVLWTPTVLIFDPGSAERFRMEGYLPNTEFRAQLELGLARVAFMNKNWAEAEARYSAIVEQRAETAAAAEAQYWAAVVGYKGGHDHAALGRTAEQFKTRFSHSIWAQKASVWSA